MQIVEESSTHDPNGAALNALAGAFTGVDASSNGETIIDSKNGTDGGRYTSKVPNSFVCRGLFARGHVDVHAQDNSDPESNITAEGIKNLTAKYPTYVELFMVEPLRGDDYRLTLLPSSIELAHTYSATFSIP